MRAAARSAPLCIVLLQLAPGSHCFAAPPCVLEQSRRGLSAIAMSADKQQGSFGLQNRGTVWDNPEYTAARYMNYRRDLLPVEKAVGLTGACTYKEAWAAVHEKRVTVDGKLASLGDMVSTGQTVALDAVVLPPREPIVCYLVNKPRQVMCTCQVGETATKGELEKAAEFGTVTDLVPTTPRVVPVGRLDFDSEGLLLLTNDGSLCKLLTCPQFRIPKTYAVLIQVSKRTVLVARLLVISLRVFKMR